MTSNHLEQIQSVQRDVAGFKRSALLLCAIFIVACFYYFEILGDNSLSTPEKAFLSAAEAKFIGDEYYLEEHYKEALPYYLTAVEQAPENTDYLRKLGNTHSHLNQFKLGEQALRKAVEFDKAGLGAPTALAEDWFYLSRLYRRNSMYKEAHDSIAKSLDIAFKSNLPPDYHVKYRVDLAVNRLWRGHFDKSFEHIEKGFEKARFIHQSDSKDVAALYAVRGLYFRRLGHYEKALNDFNQALAMSINYYGANHSKVARLRSNLGNVYTLLGDNASALTQFKTALEVLVKTYGQGHQTASAVQNNIAKVLMDQGNYMEAKQALTQAMKVNETLDNGVNRYQMHTLLSLGEVNLHLEQLDEAEEYLNQALNMCLELFGRTHHVSAFIWQLKGDVQAKRLHHDDAHVQYTKAYKIYEKLFGEEHEKTKAIVVKLAALQ